MHIHPRAHRTVLKGVKLELKRDALHGGGSCDFRKPWPRPSGNSGRVLKRCEELEIDAQAQ